MALTQEFRYAVEQGNLLRVRIMLKDSLLVDTSFEQFNEMIRFAELKLDNLWINDEDDNEEFSQSTDELNIILAGLIKCLEKINQKNLSSKTKNSIRYEQERSRD